MWWPFAALTGEHNSPPDGWKGIVCVCVYHGWKYDGSGRCVEQRAEEKPFAQKIRIRSLPTKEYLGLIFAYFGEGEPPPLPRVSPLQNRTASGHIPVSALAVQLFPASGECRRRGTLALYPPGQLFLGGRPERDPYRNFPGGNILGTGDARHVSGGRHQFTVSVCPISMTSASPHPIRRSRGTIASPGPCQLMMTVASCFASGFCRSREIQLRAIWSGSNQLRRPTVHQPQNWEKRF